MSAPGEASKKRSRNDGDTNDSPISSLVTDAKHENCAGDDVDARFQESLQDGTDDKQPGVEDTVLWHHLSAEICGVVLAHADAISVIRFRAVCKNWAKGAKEDNRTRLPSGTPVLLTSGLHPERVGEDNEVEPGGFGLHDIKINKPYYGVCDGLKNRAWVGGKDDWLVTTDLRCNLELLHLITGRSIPLPSFGTILGVNVVSVHSQYPGVYFRQPHGNILQQLPIYWRPDVLLWKIALCQTLNHLDGCMAVALFSSWFPLQMIAVAVEPLVEWTRLRVPQDIGVVRYDDVCVHDGKVIAVDNHGYLCSWDLKDDANSDPEHLGRPDIQIDRTVDKCAFYLATSIHGDIQLVCLYGDKHPELEDQRWNKVAELRFNFIGHRYILCERDIGTQGWRVVKDLGCGCSLFVGANNPFYLDIDRYRYPKDHIRSNCVYLADMLEADATIFNVKKGYKYDYNIKGHLSYETLEITRQMPMWYQPTRALVGSQEQGHG